MHIFLLIVEKYKGEIFSLETVRPHYFALLEFKTSSKDKNIDLNFLPVTFIMKKQNPLKLKLGFTIIIIICFGLSQMISAQDPLRFQEEIRMLMSKDDLPQGDEVFVFTGSSSIKFWSSLEEDFSGFPILNRGFGGSQMSDLIYYKDSLIFRYQPGKVFIYEGDNDIAAGKSSEEILKQAKDLALSIHNQLPRTKVYFISAKPSVARWKFKVNYIEFNTALAAWAKTVEYVEFIDIWRPMCTGDGMVMQNIFIGDDLHMNSKGYDIWEIVIRPFLDKN